MEKFIYDLLNFDTDYYLAENRELAAEMGDRAEPERSLWLLTHFVRWGYGQNLRFRLKRAGEPTPPPVIPPEPCQVKPVQRAPLSKRGGRTIQIRVRAPPRQVGLARGQAKQTKTTKHNNKAKSAIKLGKSVKLDNGNFVIGGELGVVDVNALSSESLSKERIEKFKEQYMKDSAKE